VKPPSMTSFSRTEDTESTEAKPFGNVPFSVLSVFSVCQIVVFLTLASGCVLVPDHVKAEFSAPDGKRPNHYHACRSCAEAAKAGQPKGGASCIASAQQ
jgi:hypothetical protein